MQTFKLPKMPLGHSRMLNNLHSMQRTSSKAIGLSPQKQASQVDLMRRNNMQTPSVMSTMNRLGMFQSQSELGQLTDSPVHE